MGPSQKPNVCCRLSRRALGFFSRDAGVVQRTNLGILRALVCQVTTRHREPDLGRRGDGEVKPSCWGAVFLQDSPFLRSHMMVRVIQALKRGD